MTEHKFKRGQFVNYGTMPGIIFQLTEYRGLPWYKAQLFDGSQASAPEENFELAAGAPVIMPTPETIGPSGVAPVWPTPTKQEQPNMQTHHTLKTDPALFRAVRDGRKRFDVRKDDRAFQCGDLVTLEYFDPENPNAAKVGRPPMPPNWVDPDPKEPLTFRIGFVLRGGQYGVDYDHVAFQLEPVSS